MRGVLGENDSTPGGDVLACWESVGERQELVAEFLLLRVRGRTVHSIAEKYPVPVVCGLGFKSPREEWVSRDRWSAKGGKAQGDVENGGQVDRLVVDVSSVWDKVGGAVM